LFKTTALKIFFFQSTLNQSQKNQIRRISSSADISGFGHDNPDGLDGLFHIYRHGILRAGPADRKFDDHSLSDPLLAFGWRHIPLAYPTRLYPTTRPDN